jgi:hypothetical protein
MYRQPIVAALSLLMGACGISIGASTAATTPLVGSLNDHYAAQQGAYSSRFLGRTVNSEEGIAFLANYVSFSSAFRKEVATSGDFGALFSGDASLQAHVPLPVGPLAIGPDIGVVIGEELGISGWGLRGSYAPIGQLSLDLGINWMSGSLDHGGGDSLDVSGTRTSFGATLMLWAAGPIRLALSAAWNRTATDVGSEQGLSGTLVWSIY